MSKHHGDGLALQEYYETGDNRFMDELRATQSPRRVGALANTWKRDPRPWARAQIFTYLRGPIDRPGHEALIRRLFKHAEEQRDHELMGAFLVAFDRLVRREVAKRWVWEGSWQNSWTEEYLASPRNRIPHVETRPLRSYEIPKNGVLFSNASRYYLRRRAWRYFRRLGYQQPTAYVGAVSLALERYRDEDLAEGQNILDSWGLANALFRHADVLAFGRSHVNVAEGKSFGDLASAPRFPQLWREDVGGDTLYALVVKAESQLVRVFAMDTIRAHHPSLFERLGVKSLLALFDLASEEVHQFAAEQLVAVPGLGALSIDVWLALLQTKNPEALQAICDAMEANVRPERLDLVSCVRLACAEPLPVARLALAFIKAKRIDSAEDRAALAKLADTRCTAMGSELTSFALDTIGTSATYRTDEVVAFLDSATRTVREAAWEWVMGSAAAYDDPVLWARLAETPYIEMRLRLVDSLEGRLRAARLGEGGATSLWTTVLLGVHQGGRQKLKAVRQLCEAVIEEPARATKLLPVLGVAVRSIRAPEMRGGLSAVLTLLERRPALASAVATEIPELELAEEGAA